MRKMHDQMPNERNLRALIRSVYFCFNQKNVKKQMEMKETEMERCALNLRANTRTANTLRSIEQNLKKKK